MIKKIVSLGEEFDEYYKEEIESLGADFFVYSYEEGCYDGSGFAIWKKGDEWFYTDMGHCSCYGPLEYLRNDKNVGFTFEQIKEIATKENYNEHAYKVLAYIIENK